MKNKLRFGIIGCSGIAERSTIPAIKNSQFAELQMIGSRSEKKAEEFAKKFGCQNFGTYEDVLENNDVDVVYISVPIGLHEEWTVKAAKSGKHVLCEKSSTTSYESARRMVDSCKQNNVRLMEGFMFRFHPQHKKVLELIKNGMLGKLFVFSGMYGFPPVSFDTIRYKEDLGGGVLNETGCYPMCASRVIFGEEPVGIMCNLQMDKNTKVDVKGHAYILYKDDRAAHLSFGFENYYQASYKIWGEKGVIDLQRAYAVPPDLKTVIHTHTNDKIKDEITIDNVDHFTLMIESFCKELLHLESAAFNFEDDLLMQARVMDAARISNREKRFVQITELTHN